MFLYCISDLGVWLAAKVWGYVMCTFLSFWCTPKNAFKPFIRLLRFYNQTRKSVCPFGAKNWMKKLKDSLETMSEMYIVISQKLYWRWQRGAYNVMASFFIPCFFDVLFPDESFDLIWISLCNYSATAIQYF